MQQISFIILCHIMSPEIKPTGVVVSQSSELRAIGFSLIFFSIEV